MQSLRYSLTTTAGDAYEFDVRTGEVLSARTRVPPVFDANLLTVDGQSLLLRGASTCGDPFSAFRQGPGDGDPMLSGMKTRTSSHGGSNELLSIPFGHIKQAIRLLRILLRFLTHV